MHILGKVTFDFIFTLLLLFKKGSNIVLLKRSQQESLLSGKMGKTQDIFNFTYTLLLLGMNGSKPLLWSELE